jgi:DNA repair protein RecO (recombination protein O)
MRIKTEGLIIREQPVGESDRLVSVLTRDNGVVKAFARRAKKVSDNKNAATTLLSYSKFDLYMGENKNVIERATPVMVFLGLGKDIVKLSMAQYFCDLARLIIPEQMESEEIFRLMLNSLYLLSETERDPFLIKPVFELRLMCLTGYEPDLHECIGCGKKTSEIMYFLTDEAQIICSECYEGNDKTAIPVSEGVLKAMRHIEYSDFEKIFSFSLAGDRLGKLNSLTERYIISILGFVPNTLKFLKSVI